MMRSQRQLEIVSSNRFSKRGQGTFEYVLLLGGVLLIVVLALVVLQGTFQQSASGVSDVQLKQCKLAAQSSPSCFSAGGSFNGSKTFSMLGYQANPLLCNCSDYNPDAFTVSVGQAGVRSLAFETVAVYSSLSFGSASIPSFSPSPGPSAAPSSSAYAFSIALPPGRYQFFLVLADGSETGLGIGTVSMQPDGTSSYSWNNLPVGSKIKINPLTKISNDQKNKASQSRVQSASANDLENTMHASKPPSKNVLDASDSLDVVKNVDGKLRAIYSYAPDTDFSGNFAVSLPLDFSRIAASYPVATRIQADPNAPDATLVSFDQVNLKAGQQFKVIVEFKTDLDDPDALSADVATRLGKLSGITFVKKVGVRSSAPSCPTIPIIGVTIPIGCTAPSASVIASASSNPSASVSPTITPMPTAQCPTIPILGVSIPFGCITPTPAPTLVPTDAPTATPIAIPSATPLPRPTPSPSPSDSASASPLAMPSVTASPSLPPSASPTPSLSACPTAPTSAMVLYLPLDEKQGNYADYSGNNNGGIRYGGLTSANGMVQNAAALDGSTGFIYVPYSDSLGITNALSVSFWMNGNSVQSAKTNSDGHYLVIDKSHGFTDVVGWAFQGNLPDGKLSWYFGNNADWTAIQSVTSKNSLLDNQWHHVVGTYDGTALRLYVDNVLQGTASLSGPIPNNHRAVEIGSAWGGGSRQRYFDGMVDEVRIYSLALDTQEISTLYNMATPTPSCPVMTPAAILAPVATPASLSKGQVLSLPLDETAGNPIDSSSAAHSANIQGTIGQGIDGAVNTAYSFPGSSSSFVSVSPDARLNFDVTDAFSISAWLKTTQTNDGFLVAKEENSGNYRGYYLVYSHDHYAHVLLETSNDNYISVGGSTALNDGQWHHLVGSYNGNLKADGVLLYVDGKLEQTTQDHDNLGSTIANAVPLTVGSRDGGGVPFLGSIDEVGVWNRVLGSDEIGLLYAQGKNQFPSGSAVHYGFDEPSGNPMDASGNGNVGQSSSNGLSYAVPGIIGQALGFDGQNGYVNAGTSPLLNPAGAMTISAWIYPTSFSGNGNGQRTIIERRRYGSQEAYQLILSPQSNGDAGGGPRVSLWLNGQEQFVDGTLPVPLKQWTLLSATYDGSVIKLYINGVLNGQKTASGSISQQNLETTIGAGNQGTTNYFTGSIDDVSLFNRALTSAEIAAMYAAGSTPSTATSAP